MFGRWREMKTSCHPCPWMIAILMLLMARRTEFLMQDRKGISSSSIGEDGRG
jgi:hypothetical protein